MQVSLKFPRQETNQFFAVLRQRVNQYFQEKNISKNGNTHMVVKTIAMLSIYFVPYALILTGWLPGWAMLLLAMVMGVGMSGIGFSVMHDSNHGSYSKNSTVNRILGHTMELLGGSSFTWKMQHGLGHSKSQCPAHRNDRRTGWRGRGDGARAHTGVWLQWRCRA